MIFPRKGYRQPGPGIRTGRSVMNLKKRSTTRSFFAAGLLAFIVMAAGTAAVSAASAVENAETAVSSAEDAAELPDGIYEALFQTDSSMFSVNEADEGKGILTVRNGEMTIHIRLMSKKILNLYCGLKEGAEKEGAELLQPSVEEVTYKDGYTEEVNAFDVPVPALDEEFDLALIGTKGKWYDHRVMVTEPVPVPGDGDWLVDVTLEGGTGKASVTSPCAVTVRNGEMTARIEFSSPHYDYLIKDGMKYLPVNTEGNSVFEIPVSGLDEPVPVTADTTAMSVPHEIEYILNFDASSITAAEDLSAAGLSYGENDSGAEEEERPEITAGNISLKYAREFSASLNADGSADVVIGEDTFHIGRNFDTIYLAASSAMDLFMAAGAEDHVAMTGTRAEDWGISRVREMVEDGTIRYAGKYSAPDYELLLSEGCDLAVESTMIYHSPDVKEKLESLGIPVLVERSSYEAEPLGRMEWIRLYGLLTGRYEEATAFFEQKVREVEELKTDEKSGRSVVFFYISSSGQPVVRKPGDYVSRMIEMAGGTYFLSDDGGEDTMLSSMNMQMEAFLKAAEGADIMIYNSSIDAELRDLDELLEKEPLLSSFRAVQEGNVWCTGKNMFQETSAIADMILELHSIINDPSENGENLRFIHKLERR